MSPPEVLQMAYDLAQQMGDYEEVRRLREAAREHGIPLEVDDGRIH